MGRFNPYTDQNAKKAQEHTKDMEQKYAEQIAESVKHAIIYDDFTAVRHDKVVTDIVIEDMDTVSAMAKYFVKDSTAVLNFASYKNPGGKFLQGSMAQEEALCHESFLYNVLREFKNSYYAWNEKNKNHALYQNRALYAPDVYFFKDGKAFTCDVITCAAPNKTAALKYRMASAEENFKALEARIKFVLSVAADNFVDTLILGAFGCGVFGQDPYEVASLFKLYLQDYAFEKVVFAIPGGKNLKAFKDTF